MAGWNQNDLTVAAATGNSEGEPWGHVFDAQGTQHVIYCGPGSHVTELWWDASGWHANDLSSAGGAPPTASNPRGYVFDAQGTQHVNYRGADAHVHELWWDSSGWHQNDLTAVASGAPNAVGNPSGYVFVGQGTQHVNYLGVDNHIHELWWDSSGWHHNDLTSAASAPAAGSDPFGYVFNAQGTQHVNYRGSDGHIHELWWDGSWHHNDLTAAAGAPAASGNPYGYVFVRQGTQHVNYRGTDSHVHELWWDSSGWHHNDLTASAGAPEAVSDPRGYDFAAQGTQHVNFFGTDGHVHELWWDGAWHHNDLTVASASKVNANGLPNAPRGYVFGAQATQHVDFWGADGHIHELWWSPPCSMNLGLNEQHQQQDNWCWSATTVSISLFYDAASPWTQCTLVNQAFDQTSCCTNGSSAACNQGWWPNLSLPITGNLASYTNASASLATVMAEINSGRPISIAIWWDGGGGHNPAIDGYDNCVAGTPTIDIQDPWYGPSTQDFNSFPSTYNGGASWGNTYFTHEFYAA